MACASAHALDSWSGFPPRIIVHVYMIRLCACVLSHTKKLIFASNYAPSFGSESADFALKTPKSRQRTRAAAQSHGTVPRDYNDKGNTHSENSLGRVEGGTVRKQSSLPGMIPSQTGRICTPDISTRSKFTKNAKKQQTRSTHSVCCRGPPLWRRHQATMSLSQRQARWGSPSAAKPPSSAGPPHSHSQKYHQRAPWYPYCHSSPSWLVRRLLGFGRTGRW